MAMTRALLAAIAITIAATQFLALRAPRALHLPPQQTVATTNAKLGIHTRLTGVGDEAYIRRSLEQVREMGAGWIVDLFPWAYVQPRSRYGYDWAGADMVVQHARRQGLTIVARLDIVPEWARSCSRASRSVSDSSALSGRAAGRIRVTSILKVLAPLNVTAKSGPRVLPWPAGS
jgi:polysaccharide biosynthesis protein PslG